MDSINISQHTEHIVTEPLSIFVHKVSAFFAPEHDARMAGPNDYGMQFEDEDHMRQCTGDGYMA